MFVSFTIPSQLEPPEFVVSGWAAAVAHIQPGGETKVEYAEA